MSTIVVGISWKISFLGPNTQGNQKHIAKPPHKAAQGCARKPVLCVRKPVLGAISRNLKILEKNTLCSNLLKKMLLYFWENLGRNWKTKKNNNKPSANSWKT